MTMRAFGQEAPGFRRGESSHIPGGRRGAHWRMSSGHSSRLQANEPMEGYGLREGETADATTEQSVRLRLVGEVPAGQVYAGVVGPGEAVRILTGAPLPAGADAVIQQELVELADGLVSLMAPVAPGNNVRAAGDDVQPGALLVPSGSELGPAELALLAALGIHPVRVAR